MNTDPARGGVPPVEVDVEYIPAIPAVVEVEVLFDLILWILLSKTLKFPCIELPSCMPYVVVPVPSGTCTSLYEIIVFEAYNA